MTAAVATAMIFSAAGVYAGQKFTVTTSVSPTFAIAGMGDTRASADATASVGCTVASIAANFPIAMCSITDPSGATKMCFSSDPSVIQAASSFTANSTLRLLFDASGNCTQVYVDNYSAYRPITP